MKCPKCGHEFKAPAQTKGGRNRWKGLTKKQRSEAMKRVRRGSANTKLSDGLKKD